LYVEPAKPPPESLNRDDGRDGERGTSVDDTSRKLDGGRASHPKVDDGGDVFVRTGREGGTVGRPAHRALSLKGENDDPI